MLIEPGILSIRVNIGDAVGRGQSLGRCGTHSRPVKEGGKCVERLFGSGFMSIECVFDSQAEGDIIADACLYTRIFPNCRPPP